MLYPRPTAVHEGPHAQGPCSSLSLLPCPTLPVAAPDTPDWLVPPSCIGTVGRGAHRQLGRRAAHQDAASKGTESSLGHSSSQNLPRGQVPSAVSARVGSSREDRDGCLCEMLRKLSPPSHLLSRWLGGGGGRGRGAAAPPGLTAESAGLQEMAILWALALWSL